MSGLFAYTGKLTSLNVDNFKTSNVIEMDYMFYGMHSINFIDLSNFNTKKVKNMKYMFANCENLTSIKLSNFDTSKVTNFQAMFLGLNNIELDLTSFNFLNGEIFTEIFYGCENLIIYVNEELSNNEKFINEIQKSNIIVHNVSNDIF